MSESGCPKIHICPKMRINDNYYYCKISASNLNYVFEPHYKNTRIISILLKYSITLIHNKCMQ